MESEKSIDLTNFCEQKILDNYSSFHEYGLLNKAVKQNSSTNIENFNGALKSTLN